MINRDGLEEDFEKIKDHTKKSPRKWKVLSDTLSSMYSIDKARAVEMWEYIIKNNEDAVRSGDTSYTINLLRRLSYEDNHKPMKEYEIVNFISESSIIFKSIFLYGDLNYGGHLADDYIIRLIKLGKSELAQMAYGYRLLNMNNVDNAMVKKIIDNIMVLIKSNIIEGTPIYYDGFDKFLEYARQNASETHSQMIEVFLLLVKSDDERSQIEGIQNKLSALSVFFKQNTPFSRAAYECYLLTQNMLLTVTDYISAQAVLDDCIDYMKNVRREGCRKSDLENHIFERHLKIVLTNAKALELIFQSSNNDIADIIIFTVLVEKEWGTLNRIIAIVKQFSEASYYYINYLSSVIDRIENNCEKADKEYLVGAYCKILLDHEFDLNHYKIDEKIEEMFCKQSAVIISESNVNFINTNLDKEISKWKNSYEKLGRNLDIFIPSGNIEQDVTSIINLSLTLLKNQSTTDLDTKIYKFTQTLLSIYEKCRYLDTNYDLDYQKNSSLEKKYNDREMLKFYLLRIAFIFEDYDMMDTIFLDMRKYLGDKEVAIRNISMTLESKVEKLQLLLMGIAAKCAHHHIHQGNARQVYREYLWYKDRFKEFPRVLYRSPYIKLDRNRINYDSCIQSNLEKMIIDKLLLTIDEFLNDCERDAIKIKQSHEELKQYLIAENIRKAELEALQEKKRERASQRAKSSTRNINLLRQIGYETSLPSDIRQQILLELALPEFGERVVVENLKLLIEKRKRTTYDEQRQQKSIYALESDIDFIIETKK